MNEDKTPLQILEELKQIKLNKQQSEQSIKDKLSLIDAKLIQLERDKDELQKNDWE